MNNNLLVYVVSEIQQQRDVSDLYDRIAEQENDVENNEISVEPEDAAEPGSKEIDDDDELPEPDDGEDAQEKQEQRDQAGDEERAHCEFFSENRVQARGGIAGLEYDLGETCLWFKFVGHIQIPVKRGGRIWVPPSTSRHLIEAWRAEGAPKIVGWRRKGVELYQAVHRALGQDARPRGCKPSPNREWGYNLVDDSFFDDFRNIIKRLERGQVVKTDLKTVIRGWRSQEGEEDFDKLSSIAEEQPTCELWLWRKDINDEFKVCAEIHSPDGKSQISTKKHAE